jgi:hypothetical protein
VQFAIEFFSEGSAGQRDLLDRMAISFESVDRAEAFAVTIAKNIKMSDRVADLCVISDKRGRALREVRLTLASDVPSAVRSSSASVAPVHNAYTKCAFLHSMGMSVRRALSIAGRFDIHV